MYSNEYVMQSVELHLFFGRIMKEHAFFLKAGFTPAGAAFARRAGFYQKEFENLLSRAVALSGGVVSRAVAQSGELVTEFTPTAEAQTERLTGIPINKEITGRQLRLHSGLRTGTDGAEQATRLNRRALQLLEGLIALKEQVLESVLTCKTFTANYPLLLEHILREAETYRQCIQMLEQEGTLTGGSQCFWNRIMMEHALFVRGLSDPTEEEIIRTADTFAGEYAVLLKACQSGGRAEFSDALAETVRFRAFNTAGVQGIEACKIRSIILPLLADHVLREANHYVRLLQGEKVSP